MDNSERKERLVLIVREPHQLFLLGLRVRSGAYSAKLLAGTKQRFAGFRRPRQCGDDALRMLVTGGPAGAWWRWRALGGVDIYRIHKTMAAMVTTAR